jgi:hypothetical protein
MPGRRKPPWASLPKYTPGQAPRRRQKAQKAWWEYALMFLSAFIAGAVKGARHGYKRTTDGKRAAFAPPLRRPRRWW